MHTPEWLWIPRLSRVPLRAEPSHRSEQVSELLWGEPQQVLDHEKGWLLVRGWIDGYVGWIPAGTLLQAYYDGSGWAIVKRRWAPLHHHTLPVGEVPFGALFPRSGIWRTAIGDFWVEPLALLPLEPHAWEEGYLEAIFQGVPYQWGGKSPAGIDCSGLTQIIYRSMGRRLPRDAYQQAEIMLPTADPVPGDLAFFTDPAGENISHVALYLGAGYLLHATPQQGVHRAPLEGLFTHTFHSFRTLITEDFVI